MFFLLHKIVVGVKVLLLANSQSMKISVLMRSYGDLYYICIPLQVMPQLLYLHLYEINPDKGDHSYLHNALDFIKGPIDNLKEQKAGFLCGDSGPYALAVVIYSLLGDAQNSQKYLKKYVKSSFKMYMLFMYKTISSENDDLI